MSITVQNIIESYGAYYEQGGQNLNRIKAFPMQEPEMLKNSGAQRASVKYSEVDSSK